MKQINSRLVTGLFLATALFTAPSVFAQVSYTGTFTDNFSELTSTQTTAPAGWSVFNETGGNGTFAPAGTQVVGVAPNFTAGSLVAESTLIAATQTQTSTYDNNSGTAIKGVQGINYYNTLATVQNGEGSRSLGTAPSGNAATILELSLKNNTSASVNALNLSYDIDRFTATANDNNGASGNAVGLEEYPGYQLFYSLTPAVASSWVNVAALNPTIDAGTTGPVQVPNTVGITTIAPTTVNLNSAWASGATLSLAWLDDNAESPSPDQNIALNNVVVQAVPEPSSVLLAICAAALFAGLRQQRRKI